MVTSRAVAGSLRVERLPSRTESERPADEARTERAIREERERLRSERGTGASDSLEAQWYDDYTTATTGAAARYHRLRLLNSSGFPVSSVMIESLLMVRLGRA